MEIVGWRKVDTIILFDFNTLMVCRWGRGSADTRRAPHCPNLPCRLPAPPARQLSKSFDASSHELDSNQYQATCPLVDREWVCRPPHYSPPKINSISSEYILSFHLSCPMHSQYDSPNHGY